ncbi:MAG: hypothetical protein JXB38_09135, partial [Anaerolineales bacterium]|nr:hypothetical protein [Anaerolineales bacterium]
MLTPQERIEQHLQFIYGDERALQISPALQERLDTFKQQCPQLSKNIPALQNLLTEKDAILITYGDQFQQADEHPLGTLHTFLSNDLAGALNGVHILPFYPYSSDDGFSVIDYKAVDPALGDWEDVGALKGDFRLMFDAVINHISRQSDWFQGFIAGEVPYTEYFIRVDPATDLSQVVRPRALPLHTAVDTASGTQHVWTTFSADQIDLNFASPDLMLAMIDVLLFYVAQGAEIIRLDAIAYLWKEIGTSCIHLPETHAMVKLWRAVLDEVAPGVILITETNVPHEDNISYFGDPLPGSEQTDEAQMVYQF